ncbi:MAG: hypothetical protein M1836_000334 [Candelina mexicana]|nr:MAG: hypothetical protein M1836_000334 [Candelina mexicana]
MPGTTVDAETGPLSPSPPPPPPIAETPGPRASKLQDVFSHALAHTLKVCSYDNFAACFPTPAKYVSGSLMALWRQMVGKLEEAAKNEFNDIMKERDVVPNLNELDRLITEARKRKSRAAEGEVPIPPHTLPPLPLYIAHLAPFLQQTQSQLNARLQTTQSQNAQLASTISEQRAEIELLVSGLEEIVADLESAVESLRPVVGDGSGGDIGRETLDAEAALSAKG